LHGRICVAGDDPSILSTGVERGLLKYADGTLIFATQTATNRYQVLDKARGFLPVPGMILRNINQVYVLSKDGVRQDKSTLYVTSASGDDLVLKAGEQIAMYHITLDVASKGKTNNISVWLQANENIETSSTKAKIKRIADPMK
jgi:hypothetical protein